MYRTMISAPIYTHNLNGMIVGKYSQKAIGKMTAPEPNLSPPILKYMSFDITPERGDMAEVKRYFANQEAVERWGKPTVSAPKRKTTDDLMREFLIKSIDQENHRRAMKEAEADMPFAGVLAADEQRQRLATKALADAALGRASAKTRIVSWMNSPQMIARVKTLASESPSRFMTPGRPTYADSSDDDLMSPTGSGADGGSARRRGGLNDMQHLKVPALRELAKAQGIDVKGLTKPELITALKNASEK